MIKIIRGILETIGVILLSAIFLIFVVIGCLFSIIFSSVLGVLMYITGNTKDIDQNACR